MFKVGDKVRFIRESWPCDARPPLLTHDRIYTVLNERCDRYDVQYIRTNTDAPPLIIESRSSDFVFAETPTPPSPSLGEEINRLTAVYGASTVLAAAFRAWDRRRGALTE